MKLSRTIFWKRSSHCKDGNWRWGMEIGDKGCFSRACSFEPKKQQLFNNGLSLSLLALLEFNLWLTDSPLVGRLWTSQTLRSMFDTKGYQLVPTIPRCICNPNQYCVRFCAIPREKSIPAIRTLRDFKIRNLYALVWFIHTQAHCQISTRWEQISIYFLFKN